MVACITSPAAAGSYSFAPIGPPGSSYTVAYGINGSGQVTGAVFDIFTSFSSGFLYSGGVYTSLNDPNGSVNGAFGTAPYGINGAGQVVGAYVDSSFNFHAFLYSGGNYQTIAPPSVPGVTIVNSVGNSINNLGQILISASDNNGNVYNYVYANGQYSPLTAISSLGQPVYANGINDAGAIAGYSTDSNGVYHGFLLQNGQVTTLDDPNGGPPPFPLPFTVYGTQANAINNLGDVAGIYGDPNGLTHGFVYQNGVYTTVDDPFGVYGTYIYGINDKGQLAGFYVDASFNSQAFIATAAVPEPGSLTLAAAAGLAAAGWRFKRTRPGTA
jgi:probable HAF family extracellular repeat protein